MEKTTICLNGKLKEGDIVVVAPCSDYSALIGCVKGIYYVGTEEHYKMTDNATDSVMVDFYNDYSDKRIAEIEEQFRDLYDDDEKSYDELPIDETIMAPSELLRIDLDKIGEDYYKSLLNSEARTAEWCFNELLNYTHSQPKGTVYEVTISCCVDGENTSESQEFNTKCAAYEYACGWYAEMMEKFGLAYNGKAERNEGYFRACGTFESVDIPDYYSIQMDRHRWIKVEKPQEDRND